MTIRRDLGANRRDVRKALGGEDPDGHFYELAGSRDFYAYLTPNKSPKGLDRLRALAESHGCTVTITEDAPGIPGPRYKALKITTAQSSLPEDALRAAHRWAHARNFLHAFYKPTASPTWR